MYDTQSDTYRGSKHTLSNINSSTPFEIKYHFRAILLKIIRNSDTYL